MAKQIQRSVSMFLLSLMALCILTACGGSSNPVGKISYEKSKIAAMNKVKKYSMTMNFTEDGVASTITRASNGKRTYVYVSYGGFAMTELLDGDTLYTMYDSLKVYTKSPYQASSSSTDDVLPTADTLKNLTITAGTTKVGNTSYYSETFEYTVDGENVKMIYCFNGSTLKYVIVTDGSESFTMTVTNYTTNPSDELFKLPQEKGYTLASY